MLLNTLYKIISAVLAFRLKYDILRILGSDQKAYILGRYIGEVHRSTYDSFHHAKTKNLPGMAVMVNFEKAFDSVSFVTLELFGFGSVYKNHPLRPK